MVWFRFFFSKISRKRILENHWRKIYEREWNKKTLKIEKLMDYKCFLLNPTRTLPSYKSLVKTRRTLILIAFCMLIEPPLQLFIDFRGCFRPQIGLHVYFGMAFICCLNFAATIDWAIAKRFGDEKSLIFSINQMITDRDNQ